MAPNQKRRASVLLILKDAAFRGVRCPTNPEIKRVVGSLPYEDSVTQLAREGLCIAYLYGHNYRVVEIDGKKTAPAPEHYGPPHKVIGKAP